MFVLLTYNIKEFRQTNGELNLKILNKKNCSQCVIVKVFCKNGLAFN